jgi:hypothetical protein
MVSMSGDREDFLAASKLNVLTGKEKIADFRVNTVGIDLIRHGIFLLLPSDIKPKL